MTQLASDSFIRANANPIGAPWFPIGSVMTNDQFQIQGNLAEANTLDAINLQGDYYDGGITWPNDQYSEAVIATSLVSNDYVGVGVRFQTTNLINGYNILCGPGPNNSILERFINGNSIQLGSLFTTAQSDTVRLTVIGTTLTVTVNGSVAITATDSTFASGKPAIVAFVQSVGVGNAQLSSWAGGNTLTSGGSGGQIGAFLVGI